MMERPEEFLETCDGFQWDAGNSEKIWGRLRVTTVECEELFFNRPLIVGEDPQHSASEIRMYGLGQSNAGRLLFVAFTVRNRLVRVISARDMSRKERKVYQSS
jgi:uncharacterized DUF497 family protein